EGCLHLTGLWQSQTRTARMQPTQGGNKKAPVVRRGPSGRTQAIRGDILKTTRVIGNSRGRAVAKPGDLRPASPRDLPSCAILARRFSNSRPQLAVAMLDTAMSPADNQCPSGRINPRPLPADRGHATPWPAVLFDAAAIVFHAFFV